MSEVLELLLPFHKCNHIKIYSFEVNYSFQPADLLLWNLTHRMKLCEMQSLLPCISLVHQKLLYNLNLSNGRLRYCKIVYNHSKNIFTFLPDHLRKTPGSNKIIFITCLSGHQRNKTITFLCKYYTTVLKQNICYALPKSNIHLFMLLGCFSCLLILNYLFSVPLEACEE